MEATAKNLETPKLRTRLITTLAEFMTEVAAVRPEDVVAVDTETTGLDPLVPNAALLGVSVSTERLATCESFYVALNHWDHEQGRLVPVSDNRLWFALKEWLSTLQNAVGQNWTFDHGWLRHHLGVSVNFKRDTAIMWHLSNAPWKSQSYSLKFAQTELLGWPANNAEILHRNMAERGGAPNQYAGFAKADLPVLAEYAALDAFATRLVFDNRAPFFDKHGYWEFEEFIERYKTLLVWNTVEGVPVNGQKLKAYVEEKKKELAEVEAQIRSLCKSEIAELEAEWLEEWVSECKTSDGRNRRLAQLSKHPKFNIASDQQIAALLYRKLGFPVTERTEKGAPKTNKLALKRIDHDVARLLLKSSKLEKLITSFAEPYLAAINPRTGRLHPSWNITGTVSGRCSGFKPNPQQMPFKEKALMECFEFPEGMAAIHMDLVSIEPFFTAYFSGDPVLLKVYRDGQGDIYLDLALRLFPHNEELRNAYDPKAKPSAEVKARFEKERSVSKLVHLACQYGGGAGTVSRLLTLNGFPTGLEEARRIVAAYWATFSHVRRFERLLYDIYTEDGKLTNPFGRIVRLPAPHCKDLLSRFIQGTATDCLKFIVDRFVEICRREALTVAPLLIDTHDATDFLVPQDQSAKAALAMQKALDEINSELALEFPVRGEIKILKRSLAEIK